MLLRELAPILLAGVLAACSQSHDQESTERAAASVAADAPARAERQPLFYRNPMDPRVTSPTPAKDSMGMDYVPVYSDETASGEVTLSAAAVQKLAVRSVTAISKPSRAKVRVSGRVAVDERRTQYIYAPAAGRVEKLKVRSVGDAVQFGEVVLEVYSPMLATVDAQYLQAIAAGGDAQSTQNALALRSMGLTNELIGALREQRRAVGYIPLRADVAGVVTTLSARPNAEVAQGAAIMEIAPLDPVWTLFSVPQSQAADVAVGDAIVFAAAAQGNRQFAAKVDYTLPQFDAETRTVQVRATVANEDRALLPGMYLSGTISGSDSRPLVHVPRTSVVRGVDQDHVIIARGEGRFAVRRVVIVRESGDELAISAGLAAGEQVVANALFLIDSEASLRAALADAELTETTRTAADPAHPTAQH